MAGIFNAPATKATAPQFADRVRADLQANPRFATWQHRVASQKDVLSAPQNFGINYLPEGTFLNKNGELVTMATGSPLAAKLMIAAPLAGAGIAGLAGGTSGAAASSAPAVNWAAAPSASSLFAPTATTAASVAPAATTAATAATHFGLTAPELFRVGGGAADTILGLINQRGQSKAASRAADLQMQGLREQLAFERENEVRRREEYDRLEAQQKAQWDAREAAMAPYRAASAAILSRYTGQPAPAYAPQPFSPTPPATTAPVLRPQTVGDLARPYAPTSNRPPEALGAGDWAAPGTTTPPLTAPRVTAGTIGSFLDPTRFGHGFTPDPRMRY